jgi:LuxR family maltose regulon positive regulatory protein
MLMPVFAVQIRIELARAYLALGDLSGARTVMGECDEILRSVPDLGALTTEAVELNAALANHGTAATAGPSALTTAELRLLPLLCTHMTTKDIAAEMWLSPNTVKSHIRSIYLKLDANTRHEAVTRARHLRLVG